VLVLTQAPISIASVLEWGFVVVTGLIGTVMIAVGMLEEMPGIISDVWSRSFEHHDAAASSQGSDRRSV
jgi:hypothetical protein